MPCIFPLFDNVRKGSFLATLTAICNHFCLVSVQVHSAAQLCRESLLVLVLSCPALCKPNVFEMEPLARSCLWRDVPGQGNIGFDLRTCNHFS